MRWWDPGATAIVVPVHEAEPVIGELRRLHSPSGRDGMIAHVSLLAPLAGVDYDAVEEVAAEHRAFPFRLAEVGRFESAVYLAPDPAEPFVALAEALRDRIPAEPVPGGRVIPHVTIASRVEAAVLDDVEERVRPLLPITATARTISVLERGADLRWRELRSVAL